jgi:predicted ester cyclase
VDQSTALFQGWAAAFPDSRATFHGAVAAGNTVVLEITWAGTHQGPLETPGGRLAPTGKRIEIRACMVLELSGEQVRIERHYFDMATLLRQIAADA